MVKYAREFYFYYSSFYIALSHSVALYSVVQNENSQANFSNHEIRFDFYHLEE